jgi:23S rRNA pseudouridine1911/1915/1917 synthase
VHSDGRSREAVLTDWLLDKYPKLQDVGEPLRLSSGEIINRPGIVHRIDRETSGVLLIAKDQKSFFYLKSQFQNRLVLKTYNAFLYGAMKIGKGLINRPIGKSRKDFRLYSAQRGARGQLREAITEYLVLKKDKNFSFAEIYPKTGRTHQIRAHFKAIHHPIVCDKLYAPKHKCALGFTRLALHARSLSLALPSGCRIIVEAPLPEDFVKAIGLVE